MSDAEKEIVRMVFEWIDSFGPGGISFTLGDELTDDECAEVIDAAMAVAP